MKREVKLRPVHRDFTSEYFGKLLYRGDVTLPSEFHPYFTNYQVSVYQKAYIIQNQNHNTVTEVTPSANGKGFFIKEVGSETWRKDLLEVAQLIKENIKQLEGAGEP